MYETGPDTKALAQIFGIYVVDETVHMLIRRYDRYEPDVLGGEDVEIYLKEHILPWPMMARGPWEIIAATEVIDTAYVLPVLSNQVPLRGDLVFWVDKELYDQEHLLPAPLPAAEYEEEEHA